MNPNRPRAYSALLALTIGVVSTVLTSSTAATVYVASGASRSERPDSSPAAPFPTGANRQAHAARALLDSLVEPLGPLPVMDSATLRTAVALLAVHREKGGWIGVERDATVGLDTLTFMRAWARSAPLPAYWGVNPGFTGIRRAFDLPTYAYYPMRRFMLLNEAAADSALLDGNAALAVTHARETLAASRHLLTQSGSIDLVVARVMVQRGARLLVRSAQQGDDPITAGAARRLDGMASAAFTVKPQAYRALGAAPEDGRLLSLAADTTLHDAVRMQAFVGLLSGACVHPREVLFGLSSARRMTFQQIAQAIEDIPRARDLAMLYEREFDYFDEGSPEALPARARRTRTSPLMWIVPASVENRVEMCRQI